MQPHLENSSNTAGRKKKKKRKSREDDEIVEGLAADWIVASGIQKKPKLEPSQRIQSLSYLDSGNSANTMASRERQQSRPLQSISSPESGAKQSSQAEPDTASLRWTLDPTKLGRGKKAKYYVVAKGREPGIYYSWEEARVQVDGYSEARFKSFTDPRHVERYVKETVPRTEQSKPRDRADDRRPPYERPNVKNEPTPRRPAYPAPISSGNEIDQPPPPSSSLPGSRSLTTCTCARPDKDFEVTVQCANPHCSTGSYHKTCVGLGNGPVPSGWPCLLCQKACNCDKKDNLMEATVQCANVPNCSVGTYHKKCVGLATRKETTGWRCVACRPIPSLVNPTSTLGSSAVLSSPLNTDQRFTPYTGSLPSQSINPLLSAQPEPPLHPEQERIVDCIMQGRNVFYTGSAGVGKSTVLKNFVNRLKQQGKKIDIVAPSGIAALNVGGMTTFSYAGWTPDSFKEPLANLVAAANGKKVRKRLCKTDVLVIDEISMVERDVFIRLDKMMRAARHGWKDWENPGHKPLSNHSRFAPFGGVQLVITGDWCQLPPVKPFRFCLYCGGDELPGHDKKDGRPLTCTKCSRVYLNEDQWAFRCENWDHCEFSYFELKHVHRQSDEQFISILQKCRYDEELLPSEKVLLTKPKADPLGAVRILPRKTEVEAENNKKFKLLQGASREYECHDVFSWRNRDEPELKKKGRPRYPERPDGPLEALKDHRFEEAIEFKAGMLVILLCNLSFPDGLVNGSQGKIIGFEPYDPEKPVVAKPEKSLQLERVEFQDEQIRTFMSKAKSKEWPIVQFTNGITRPIYAQCPISELGTDKPYSLLARTQIPLLAAWAITIHKSQGLSLDKVIVNLERSFEREMMYVALSRARTLEGLKVIKLPDDRDRGRNREVAEFLLKHFGGRSGLKAMATPDEAPRKPNPLALHAVQAQG